MNSEPIYYKHYITTNSRGEIINGFSDAFRQPNASDICINEQGGYQFRLFPDGEENPLLFDFDCEIPLYKWDGTQVVCRTEEELAADRAAAKAEAEAKERERRANATETVLLEMAADHEERLCLIEMGVSANDL